MNANKGNIEISPLAYARTGGLLYLVIIVVGLFNEVFVRSGLTVSGDPAASAVNILASEQLWRIGFAGSIIMLLCAVAVTWILYVLLRPVSRDVALLAVFFNLVSMSIEALNNLNLFAVLLPLSGYDYLHAFEDGQLQVMAYNSLRLHSMGYNISLLFFAFVTLLWGYLIYHSKYFPRILGVLLIICSLCYATNSLAWFLAPSFAGMLFPALLLPCFVAEAALCLWLIVKGLNVDEWNRQANISGNE